VVLTPPGSACSIRFGTGVVKTAPGCVEILHLVVSDINAARSQLVERGVEVSEVETYGGDQGRAVDDPEQAESYGTGRRFPTPSSRIPTAQLGPPAAAVPGWAATPTASSGGRDKGARDAVVGRAACADEQ
jgi:hypothetical protein